MFALILPDESFKVIGICMEVHRQLGMGFKEIIYKDALSIEFKNQQIPFRREKKFDVLYKGIVLPHCYFADFVVYDTIILEIKSAPFITNNFIAQTINYLRASGIKLGIIINFGEKPLVYKRVVF
ncbi:MAG: GxxExxY protein [Bacteroidetes bacterium]|nr:GxxExxY protein [Bacteroidota bacterium]